MRANCCAAWIFAQLGLAVRACSSAVEQVSYTHLAPGSNPGRPTKKNFMTILRDVDKAHEALFFVRNARS
jgi:hypothetical protein